MKISVSRFKGVLPTASSYGLDPSYATNAVDCDFYNGSLRPLKANKKVADDKSCLSIYDATCCLITEDDCATYAEGMAGCDDRVYKTSTGNAPMVASIADACKGLWSNLGFPCPKKPIAISNLSEVSDEEEVLEFTSAVATYVNKFGEESQPTLPSAVIKINYGNKVVVSDIPLPDSEYAVKETRVYLYKKGVFHGGEKENPKTGEFFYAGSLKSGQTSGSFVFGEFKDALSTHFYESPPVNLHQIASWRTGQLVGLDKNRVCFSLPNTPWAWPAGQQMIFYGKAIALKVAKTFAYVLTDDAPFVVSLNANCDIEQCHRGAHYFEPLPIIGARSAAIYNDTVIYATKRGMVALTGANAEVIPLWDEHTIGQIEPDQIIGEVFEGYYYGFSRKLSFRFKIGSNPGATLTYLSDVNVLAAHSGRSGRLYISTTNGVFEMFGGADFRSMLWERHWRLPSDVNMGAYRICSKFSNHKLSHYSAGQLIDEELHVDESPQRLPLCDSSKDWGVRIEGNGEVESYELGAGIRELY